MVKILIVDDEESILRMLAFALKKEGYTIISANNGKEGLMKAEREHPNLIISDVMMPLMDGLEMCERVRQVSYLSNTPFIFLTAKGDMSTQIKGLQSGADDFIIKPIDFKLLLSKVKQMLNYDLASDSGLSEPELFTEVHLSGSFTTMKPTQVLQTIDSDRLTGVLSIDDRGVNQGQITFYKGAIVSAEFKTKTAQNALYEILELQTGSFKFIVRPIALEGETPQKVATLIMEWTAQQAQESEHKKKFVLSRETQFDIILVEDFFQLTANSDVQMVIKVIQTGGNVGTVFDSVDISKERIIKIFKFLLSKGVLKVKK